MSSESFELTVSHRPYSSNEVLNYYDGPLLFWLPYEDHNLLAISVPDDNDTRSSFLVAELSDGQRFALESNTLTLANAYLTALKEFGVFYMSDYYAESLVLERVYHIPEEWMPGDVMLT